MRLRWKFIFIVYIYWVGGVEELRIKPSQLSTKFKLKLKLSLAKSVCAMKNNLFYMVPQIVANVRDILRLSPRYSVRLTKAQNDPNKCLLAII